MTSAALPPGGVELSTQLVLVLMFRGLAQPCLVQDSKHVVVGVHGYLLTVAPASVSR